MTRAAQLVGANRPGRAVVAAAAGGAAVATILDFLGFFNSIPFLPAGASIVALAVVGFFASSSLGRGLVVVFAVAWALVLPHVRWNPVKAFYLDCGTVEAGMSIGEVRARMLGYHLQNENATTNERAEGLDRAHLTFHPSIDRSADWCLVFLDRDRVVSVQEMRD